MAVTPDWAQFDHPQQGFDPEEVRWHRKNKKLLIRVIYHICNHTSSNDKCIMVK